MKVIEDGHVASAQGFDAGGIHAGVKEEAKDMALVYSHHAASAAAVYTTNKVQAAPIHIDREHLADGAARAVILNSGNANACTGQRGLEDGRRMCQLTAAALELASADVLVCSTGVIGVTLPMAAIEAGIPKVVEARAADGGHAAAEAIMTTDTVPKSFAVEVEVGGKAVRVGGMAKGAGMIAPNMATMLAVVTTDAALEAGLLQELLLQAVQRSFNCITVDGDMSTNDTVVVLANGASSAPLLKKGSAEVEVFYAALEEVCRQLARKIARDGEGATKLIEISAINGRSEAEARQVGLSVANSSLVKTAVFGCDPNWGRILCASGYAGVDIDPEKLEVKLCGISIYKDGAGQDFDQEALIEAMRAEHIPIEIDLAQGAAQAEVYTCDFSYDYVRINAEYTT